VLSAATAAKLTEGINALNAQIVSAAKANGAVVYDLNAFLHKIKTSGGAAGTATLSADFLGGFYTLDAVYPGPAGNALIANDFLSFLNTTYHASFPLVSADAVAAQDSLVTQIPPKGHLRTAESLRVVPQRRVQLEMLQRRRR
jgi:phospholipase/lecithinase/hemolysin